ncbi:hypothetical protein C8T65DRAFT_681618 [Cerioporus squamosus]|nr:hypothetical protein C8T65DRAFT_681618 [Cerioporus squamosus]
MAFAPDDFTTVLDRSADFKLLFTVDLPSEGPCWQQFGQQFIAHCQEHSLVLTGFDDKVNPRGPTQLPFVLLHTNTKSDLHQKRHNLYDSLTASTFTAKVLQHKRFTSIGYPWGGPWADFPMLRVVPRYGDIHSHLSRVDLWMKGLPGLNDYLDILCRTEPHPCFGPRVFTGVEPSFQARCIEACPEPRLLSQPASPEPQDVPLPADDVPDTADRMMDEREDDERPPTPQSPLVTPTDVTAPLFLPNPDVSEAPSALTAHDPTPLDRARGRRRRTTARISTGGRRPHRTRAAVAAGTAASDSDQEEGRSMDTSLEDHGLSSSLAGSTRRREESEDTDRFRPSTRRRLFSPVRELAPLPPQMVANAHHASVTPATTDPPTHEVAVTLVSAEPSAHTEGSPLNIPTHREIAAWIKRIVDTIPTEVYAVKAPMIHCDDIDQAAQILIFLLHWLFAHDIQGGTAAEEAEFRDALFRRFRIRGPVCNLTSLLRLLRFAKGFDLRVGAAFGEAVLRAVLRRALQILLSNTQVWQNVGRFSTIRWHLDGSVVEVERQLNLRATAFVGLMHLLGGHGAPLPISPFLFRHVIEGREKACIVDPAFMQRLDGDMFRSLLPWTTYDRTSPFPTDDMNIMALISAGQIDPGTVHGVLTPQAVASIEASIVSTATLGAPNVSAYVDLKAFADGLSVGLAPGWSLSRMFENRARDYLGALFNQRLEDVQTILDRLEFRSNLDRDRIAEEEEASSSGLLSRGARDLIFETEFAQRIEFYLKGVGHPDHPEVRRLVGEERFQSEAEDPLLRARLFLHTMTGSDLVPIDPNMKIKFFIKHAGNREELPEGVPVPTPGPLNIHSCFSHCSVRIEEGLRNLLREPHPYPTFQAWFHGAMMDPNSFNQA